jgi:hypothetical protein
MANMSYCMFENTAGDLSQVVEAMYEAGSVEDLDFNSYEKEGFEALYRLCKAYVREYDRLKEDEYVAE